MHSNTHSLQDYLIKTFWFNDKLITAVNEHRQKISRKSVKIQKGPLKGCFIPAQFVFKSKKGHGGHYFAKKLLELDLIAHSRLRSRVRVTLQISKSSKLIVLELIKFNDTVT